MFYKALTVIAFILLTLFMIIASASSSIYVYYNGTIIADLQGVSNFTLIGVNSTPIIVEGSSYHIYSNVIFIENPQVKTTIIYTTKFPKGVITINEKGNYTIYVIIPSSANLNYITPAPLSFSTSHGFYNLSFEAGQIEILYSFPSTSTHFDEDIYLLIGLITSDAVIAYVVLRLYKTKPEVKEKEPEVEISRELDERDKVIIEAIKKGAFTLSDITRVTNLPKTTVYRRLNRLEKLGYIRAIREGNKVKFTLNENVE